MIKQNQRMQSEKRKKEILLTSLLLSILEEIWKWNASVKKNQVKEKKSKYQAPKQMFQRLPTALAHIKSSNTSKDLLNEIV